MSIELILLISYLKISTLNLNFSTLESYLKYNDSFAIVITKYCEIYIFKIY